MSTPPPPRYRIIERGRRLVVIDSWDKGKTPDAPPAQPVSPASTTSTTSRPMQRGPMGATPKPAAIGSMLVNLACVGAADGEGRPILTTMAYYDAKGPREIILSGPAARRLGNMLSRMALALAVLALMLWVFPLLLIVLAMGFWVGIAALDSTAKPMVTRWIDGLATQSTT